MSINYNQKGIGLIEVMVSLLLLAIAVLGFSAMQMTAVKSTDQSMSRTRALTVIRGGAETMRANTVAVEAFKDAVNRATEPTEAELEKCMTHSVSFDPNVNTCTLKELATRDGLAVKKFAEQNEINIAVYDCPSEADYEKQRQCIIASWGETKAEFNDSVSDKPCAKTDGTYHIGAQCFVMEAY